MNDSSASNAKRKPAAPYVIASSADAHAALLGANKVWSGATRNVVVNIAGLPASEQQQWSTRLTFWRNVCGCQLGALSAVVAIVACVFASPTHYASQWVTLLANSGWVVAVALIGKITGLVVARLMFALSLKRLQRQVSTNAFSAVEG